LGGGLSISYDEVLEAKGRNSRLVCIQRINDNDLRKGTGGMDALLADANRAADHTVFVSAWLRDHHAAGWFDVRRPHSVICNGADPAVFHPFGARAWRAGEPLRIVTHHWSDNMAKGFRLYAELDDEIASGRVKGVELWVIGRWPREIRWRAARTFPACAGHELAALLRRCHVGITASQHEPGAMHPVEMLQCGMPLLYTADTGGTVELGEKFGVRVDGDLGGAIEAMCSAYESLRARVIAEGPSGDGMGMAYRKLVQSLLCR
jgi:glycosyltransferase involved in cell wall biosynthesis